jgi:nucleoside-triphosphatase
MGNAPPVRRLLLTGRPGVGKTTVLRRLVELLSDRKLAGFYTLEMRREGRRQGFRAITFDDREWVIAHVSFSGSPRVGKYGVDVAAIDDLADHTLSDTPETELFIVDEVGKMECLSEVFVDRVRHLLDSGRLLVAAVSEHGPGLITEIKRREESALWKVTCENRDALPEKIASWLRSPQRR